MERLYGGRLRGLYLYGSYARGDARAGSDVDVLGVLDEVDSYSREIQRTSEPRAEVALRHDVSISCWCTSPKMRGFAERCRSSRTHDGKAERREPAENYVGDRNALVCFQRAHFIAAGDAGLRRAHRDLDELPFRLDRTQTIRLLHGRISAASDIWSRMAIRTEGVMEFDAGPDWGVGAWAGLAYRF